MKTPQIGDWYTFCCHLDLYQIEDQSDIDYVQWALDEEGLVNGIWPTRREALTEIRTWWSKSPEVQSEVDGLLKEWT